MSGERGGRLPLDSCQSQMLGVYFKIIKKLSHIPQLVKEGKKKSLNLQMFILELSFVSSKQLRSWYTDTPLCPARPEGPVSSQPDAVAHTEWHTDEPNHAPPCVCRAVMLTTSALSQNHRGARRLSLKRDRQRYRQGDERRKAGELDR